MRQKRRKFSRLRKKEMIAGVAFVFPAIIGFSIFTAGPIIVALYLSFTRYDALTPLTFIGAANYRILWTDPLFWKSLGNTLYMTFLGVPLTLLIALMLAMLLNLNIKSIAWFRAIFYLPAIIPVVAAAVLWMWILSPQFGLLNSTLKLIGIQGPMWLFSEKWSKPGLILMGMWGAGNMMIIYIAGLKNISKQLYEAALLDGAGTWHKFRYITLPMLTPTIFFTMTIGIIGAFQIFTAAFIMTQGGPLDSTLFYVYYLFNNAFAFFKMGYASALAWVLFVIIFVVTMVQWKLRSQWVYYEIEERKR